MSIIMDLWHAIIGIVTTSGAVPLVIILVIAVAAAFMIEGLGSLVSATVGALIVFGLATTIYAAATAKGGANWSGMPQADWAALHQLTVASLLAYAILFAIAIGVINFVKTLVVR
jgi:ABC-type transport system involved in cytochrome bd biosynthesis fused ATPase/permease subunit